MFRSAQAYRTFLTVLMTYTLDLVGFSIVFPVLAPLLLDPNLRFFSPDTIEATRTTVLGLLFALFGISQFIGSPLAGALADHYGRYKIFLVTIALSVFGYAVMALSVYTQNLSGLIVGRIITGFCSGNFSLAQSATADLTDPAHRSRAFGILIGVGGLGFVAGPWIGGKLANPHWLAGSGAFIFAVVASIINFLFVLFFYVESYKHKAEHARVKLLSTFKDIGMVFHQKTLRVILTTYLLFSIGWGFYLVFSPTFLVQKFQMGPSMIGDIFAYMALIWFFVSMFLNKELAGRFPLSKLLMIGILFAAFGVAFFVAPSTLWPYWFIIPLAILGGALSWVNLGAIISLRSSEQMQGRALGVGGSMWSIGQIIAPLIAGPLAGWNIYSPLLLGAVILLIASLYFWACYTE
ncbi:MAG TPA: MFS transporter [Rhabdochlamydiaceae bacterium]|jgi:DHA1 family tetracycline resistance protein-like MFS transporter